MATRPYLFILLLLTLLAACTAPAPSAPAGASAAATATLTPPPVPSATPIVLPDSVARAQAAGRLTPAEAAQLAALLAARAADWRIDPADTALRVERTPAGAICLLLTDPSGAAIRLIYLTSPEPLAAAQTDLAAARAAAAAAGADPAAIAGLGLDILTGQPGAFGAAGELLGGFDPATGLWQFTPPPTPPPTPAPTETPDAAEALRQHPWEVQYTTGASGELTAQYYNATSKEIVSVTAPEIENLQKSIWEAPDGRQLIIYQDTTNAQGLAKYRYPYNKEAGHYFPEGTIAWLEPKLLVNYPTGNSTLALT